MVQLGPPALLVTRAVLAVVAEGYAFVLGRKVVIEDEPVAGGRPLTAEAQPAG
ncbi:hypothetical protein [Tessaracoccus defluvii]|uniref:Uncharacterized protein n=1 Tax=Tessaracoccus defluvii TaxID=1285901 RepID=A0A7H0H4X1_9ACTN|nr:hypothetical protein [Tessaracoccus defluvii]QNP55587.1 hypothetical protein H9L22_15670 [Tessaracoccus defluvii]